MKEHTRKRLEVEAIIIGYAMSRLDMNYLHKFGYSTWTGAFEKASVSLSLPLATFKNLRDEFDPFHKNNRKGWRNRPLRQNRLRVLTDLCEISDDALFELVRRILIRDNEATIEAIDSLVEPTPIAYNVAERLLTGRRAEEFFIQNYKEILNIENSVLIDRRESAKGFDFEIETSTNVAIEVKGLKKQGGYILFTDREWKEAKIRADYYWLVVIGNLVGDPKASLIINPANNLSASCKYQQTIVATWSSYISVS